eukprot:7379908-Prymnesium_polylepis.2
MLNCSSRGVDHHLRHMIRSRHREFEIISTHRQHVLDACRKRVPQAGDAWEGDQPHLCLGRRLDWRRLLCDALCTRDPVARSVHLPGVLCRHLCSLILMPRLNRVGPRSTDTDLRSVHLLISRRPLDDVPPLGGGLAQHLEDPSVLPTHVAAHVRHRGDSTKLQDAVLVSSDLCAEERLVQVRRVVVVAQVRLGGCLAVRGRGLERPIVLHVASTEDRCTQIAVRMLHLAQRLLLSAAMDVTLLPRHHDRSGDDLSDERCSERTKHAARTTARSVSLAWPPTGARRLVPSLTDAERT